MKKEYIKPKAYIEDFQITQFVAGDCIIKTKTYHRNTCAVDLGGVLGTVFVEKPTCQTVSQDEKLCYHIAVNGDSYFGS